MITIPGLIDTHVHLREPGATQKEDFETGSKSAIAGGYTVILDMPNNPEPTVTPQALEEKIKLAKNRIYCDVGFHFGATLDSSQY
ncbi:MAG: amidohydrolase family protein, partial [Candidatus Daviesbacteria bacterium]|nr:amidohydrolase family protein [Candidatus Daviesbacteria bacterium]